MGKLARVAVAVAVVVVAAAACSGRGASSGGSAPRRVTLHVFAAASLSEAFREMADRFERGHPAVRLRFNFAGSGVLAQQILDGAPADVFASADVRTMRRLQTARVVGEPEVIARNRLVVAFPRANSKGIDGIRDLDRDDVSYVMCAESAACGRYAAAALRAAGVTAEPRSLEHNVKAVMARVVLGEADAGLVYATDAVAAGDAVDTAAVPRSRRPGLDVTYPIAITDASRPRPAATAWVEHVLSDAGARVLRSHGFLTP